MRRLCIALLLAASVAHGQDWNMLGAMWTEPVSSQAAWNPATLPLWFDLSDRAYMQITNISAVDRAEVVTNKGTIALVLNYATYRPVLVTNAFSGSTNASLQFLNDRTLVSGTNSFLNSASGVAVVALCKPAGDNTHYLFSAMQSSLTRLRSGITTGYRVFGGGRRLFGETFKQYTNSEAYVINKWMLCGVSINYASSNMIISINGRQESFSFQTPGTTDPTNTTSITLGQGLYGYLYAVLGSSDFNDLQKMEGYVAWKNNLQTNLPITHPYYGVPP